MIICSNLSDWSHLIIWINEMRIVFGIPLSWFTLDSRLNRHSHTSKLLQQITCFLLSGPVWNPLGFMIESGWNFSTTLRLSLSCFAVALFAPPLSQPRKMSGFFAPFSAPSPFRYLGRSFRQRVCFVCCSETCYQSTCVFACLWPSLSPLTLRVHQSFL